MAYQSIYYILLNTGTDTKAVKDKLDEQEKILTKQENMLEDISSNLTDEVRNRHILSSCYAATGEMEVRKIYPPNFSRGLTVHCDGVSDDGGWMVFQHRDSGYIHFNQSWSSYVNGFGSITSDYWLGLQTLYELTSQNEYELRVDLVDWCGYTGYAQYSSFRVDGPNQNYRLHISGYRGQISDSLSSSNEQQFAVPDSSLPSCARNEFGGWWYSTYCTDSNLNGEFIWGSYRYPCYDYAFSQDPMFWDGFENSRSYQASIRSSNMKIRPKLV